MKSEPQNNEKYLWIGTVTRESDKHSVNIQVAANIVQWYYINGLEFVLNKSIDIISALQLPGYKQVKKLFIKKDISSHGNGSVDVNIGFINLKYFGHFFRMYGLCKEANRWSKVNADKNVTIFVYAMHSPFLKAAAKIKKRIPGARIVLIVPDLPQYMSVMSPLKKMMKKLDWILIKKLLDHVDGYILYTKYMAEYLNISEKKWIVIEGLIGNKMKDKKMNFDNSNKQICLYAGAITKKYSVDKLVKAFSLAGVENAELHIYGKGPYRNQLINECKTYNNIKYMGFVSPDEILSRMQAATILINPRSSNDEYTKYSCPSKTFEYISSGTPVLMARLLGLPGRLYTVLSP